MSFPLMKERRLDICSRLPWVDKLGTGALFRKKVAEASLEGVSFNLKFNFDCSKPDGASKKITDTGQRSAGLRAGLEKLTNFARRINDSRSKA